MQGFSELEVHPDVVDGVRALSDLGIRLVTLSHGSATIADTLLQGAGVRNHFERLLTVEDAGVWKPAARAYAYALKECGVEPEDAMLVAVHPWDIDGASRAGPATAWIDRQGGRYPFTEIDLKTKLDVDVAPQVTLGACRSAPAYEALTAEPSIAAVLPCNVVVRTLDENTTIVEAFDPDAMMGLANNDALSAVAADAKQRIIAALTSLDSPEGEN